MPQYNVLEDSAWVSLSLERAIGQKLCLCDNVILTQKKKSHFIKNNSNFMLLEKEPMTDIIKVDILGKLNCK